MLKGLIDRLARGPVAVSDALWESTLASVPFLARLTSAERARLRACAGQLLGSKHLGRLGLRR